jgi:DNA-directed RNA polymerase subunit RPC12/RpoP
MPAPLVCPKTAYRPVQPLLRAALVLVAALALPVHGLAQREAELRDQVAYDFRGRPLPAGMTLFGPQADEFIKPEAEGLRITLPKGRDSVESIGLSMALMVGGDFEITLAFEILQAEQPTPASYGVGVLMSVNETAGRIGRLERAKRQGITWDRWATIDGERKFQLGAAPCKGKVGRLRLKRTQTTLHFLWAPGLAGDNFEAVHQWEFDAQEIALLRIEVNSNLGDGKAGALDVRLFELKVRSTEPAAGPVAVAQHDPTPGRTGWIAAAGSLGFVILLALAASLVVRHRQRVRAPVAPAVADAQPNPEVTGTLVAFVCSGCGKRLKSRAELAGKTIKCPQCSKPVIVPAITA